MSVLYYVHVPCSDNVDVRCHLGARPRPPDAQVNAGAAKLGQPRPLCHAPRLVEAQEAGGGHLDSGQFISDVIK